jgi:hypothetical protein
MTEDQWQACTNPAQMLEFLKGRASDRKLRLFSFACVRRMWGKITDPRLKAAIEVSERHADGAASDAELRAAVREAHRARGRRLLDRAAYDAARYHPHEVQLESVITHATYAAAYMVRHPPPSAIMRFIGSKLVLTEFRPHRARRRWNAAWESEHAAQAQLLRDIFGNPFRPVTLDPSWRSPAVATLAETIYASRAFHRLPDLATALQLADCTDQDILQHCRAAGPHVRGCWVLDLLLGKA